MKLNIQLFASGSFEGSSTASKGRIRIDWSSTPSDAIQNKSSVSATVYIWRTNNYDTNGTFSGNLTINGSSIYISKKRSNWNTEPKDVGTYTIDVPHNEDGTKTCNISCELTQTGTSLAGTYTASQNVVLDTIPRASVFNSLSMVVNNDSSITITANITRRNASFTDTLTLCDTNFELNDGTNTITLSDSVNPTAKSRFYQIMGNNTQASYTAILTTKSGGSQVGNASTLPVVVSLPSYSISIGTITSSDDNADNYIRSGSTYKVSDFTSANTYLQGFSNPRLSFTLGSSSGYLYGNTINISGDASASGLGLGNNSVALGTNFTGGTKTLTASDGRKTANGTITLTRKDWNTPNVSIALERQSATGQTIDYEITYNFTSVSGGLTPKLSASYTYNGTTYTIYSEQALSNTSGTLSGTITLATPDDYKYSISASTTLTDTIDYQVSANTQIPGGKPAIYTYKDSSANNKVDIYGDLSVEKDIETNAITKAHYIELGGPSLSTPFIDFHYNNSSADYTSRIIETNSGTLAMQNNLIINGTLNTNGEITSNLSGTGQFRAIGGNYGFFIRNDGGSTYFMLTDSGNQTGGWNSLRPLTINNSTGKVTSNGINIVDTYSTNEIAIGLWIDGKTIYRKVITGTISGSGKKTISHGISGATMFIHIYGIVKDGTYCSALPFGSALDNVSRYGFGIQGANTSGTFDLFAGSAQTGTYQYVVILEYIK